MPVQHQHGRHVHRLLPLRAELLRRGGSRLAMGMLLVALALAGAAANPGPLTLKVVVHPSAAVPGGVLVFRRADGVETVTRRETLAPLVRLDLPTGSWWEVQVEAPGFWAPPMVVGGGDPRTKEIHVWRLTTVEVPFELSVKASRPPVHASANFRGRDAGGTSPSGELPCQVAELHVRCPVPAAPMDLLIRFTGYASEPFWDLSLVPGKPVVLTRRALRPGGSLIGFLEDPRGLPAQGKVELEPWCPGEPGQLCNGQREVLRTATGPHGFFQFAQVPPGSYRLRARGEGRLEAELAPVSVEADRETEVVRSVRLAEPASLEVEVTPPMMPQGRPWRVLLVALGGVPGSVAEKEVPAEGRVVFSAVRPGAYNLILVSSQNRKEMWLQRGVWVPEERQVFLEVPVVEVEGRVREGERPLPSLVAFGGLIGPVKVVLEAGHEGHFSGFLPRGGTWPVSVAGRKQKLMWHGTVEVTTAGRRRAWVDIVVDSGEICGRVTDGEGRGQAGATVELQPLDVPAVAYPNTRTAEDGSFRLQAVPGRVLLRARDERRASPPFPVSVKAGETVSGVELVLREQTVLEGQVTGFPGAVANIRVDAQVPWAAASPPRGRTDAQGHFRFLMDPGMPSATVVAFPTAANLALACTTLPAEGPLAVPLSLVPGGSLEVLDAGLLTTAPRVLARYQGCPLFLFTLREWARFVGAAPDIRGNWVFPKLPPGVWELCGLREDGVRFVLGPCTGGVLPPGGTLQLRLPQGPGSQ